MGLETGTIKGFEVKTHRDGTRPVLLLQCAISEEDDLQTVEWFGNFGEDSRPPLESEVLIGTVGNTKYAFAIDDKQTPAAVEGEKNLYSLEGGTKKAKLSFKISGELELNGAIDFAVKFTELQTLLANLITRLNTEFIAIAAVLPGYTFAPIVVDWTPAKSLDVKLS